MTRANNDDFCLLTTGTPLEVPILVARLRSEGIDAFSADDQMGIAYWPVMMGCGGVRILVPGNQLGAAQKILTAFNEGRYSLSDDFIDDAFLDS